MVMYGWMEGWMLRSMTFHASQQPIMMDIQTKAIWLPKWKWGFKGLHYSHQWDSNEHEVRPSASWRHTMTLTWSQKSDRTLMFWLLTWRSDYVWCQKEGTHVNTSDFFFKLVTLTTMKIRSDQVHHDITPWCCDVTPWSQTTLTSYQEVRLWHVMPERRYSGQHI